MKMPIISTIGRDVPLRLAYEVDEPIVVGDTLRCALKPADDMREPDKSVPEIIVTTVEFTPNLGRGKNGWRISLTSAQASSLPDGIYAVDTIIIRSGQVLDRSTRGLVQIGGGVTNRPA